MAKLSLFNLWFCCSEGCEYLEEIDLGLSSSGLREDNEDPVEEPRACRDNPDIDKGFLLSFIFILSISRFKDVFLEAWGLCTIVKIPVKERESECNLLCCENTFDWRDERDVGRERDES